MDVQASVIDPTGGFVLGIGARRVVAQFRDAPAHLVPHLMQFAQRRTEHRLGVAPDLDHATIVRLADEVAVLRQAVQAQHLHHLVAHGRRHLDDGAELLVEQCLQRQLLAPRADLADPVLRVAPVHAAVADAVAFDQQHVDVQADAEVTGERHLADRRPQAAVAAVVVRQQAAFVAQLVDRRNQRFQLRRVVQVGGAVSAGVAGLVQHLRQHRAGHAVAAVAQVDQDQRGVAGLQLRRQGATHVVQRDEGRDDQRHRRGDLLRFPGIAPARAHRQAVLADRHADAERRAQLHPDRAHGVVQRGILAGLATGSHPVAAELDPLQ